MVGSVTFRRSADPHIVASITAHGFGHAAIVTAVLRTIAETRPGCRFSIVTTVPEEVLRLRMGEIPFVYICHQATTDFGMKMASSTDVLRGSSAAAYLAAHKDLDRVLVKEAEVLGSLSPDLVLSCASYVALAGAARIGVPGVGIGPFSWLEIAHAFCADLPGMGPVLDEMRDAYWRAAAFLRTSPGIPMAHPGLRTVGPVGLPGQRRREDLGAILGLHSDERVALVALGGLDEPVAVEAWPQRSGWRWLVAGESHRSSAFALAATGLGVSDAIASADVVITKPGYGTFVEAACHGVPLLVRQRLDWPESRGLTAWFRQSGALIDIDSETFRRGDILPQLQKLVEAPVKIRPVLSGNAEASDIILSFL